MLFLVKSRQQFSLLKVSAPSRKKDKLLLSTIETEHTEELSDLPRILPN